MVLTSCLCSQRLTTTQSKDQPASFWILQQIQGQRVYQFPELFLPDVEQAHCCGSLFPRVPLSSFHNYFPLYPNDTKAFTPAHSLLEEIGFRQTVYPGRSLILRSFRRTTNPTYTHTHYTLAAFPGRLLFLFFLLFLLLSHLCCI